MCLKGKSGAQWELYNRFAPRMYTVSYRYAKNEADAKDILQEAFIHVFNKLEKYNASGSLEGWIRRITVNCAIRHYERSVRKIDSGDIDHTQPKDVREDVLSAMTVNEIMAVINQLPDGYRVVFNMYAIEGYSHKEISDALGISESSSRSQLTRARKMIIELLHSIENRTMAC